jgi:hypothetical protein
MTLHFEEDCKRGLKSHYSQGCQLLSLNIIDITKSEERVVEVDNGIPVYHIANRKIINVAVGSKRSNCDVDVGGGE